MCNGLQACTVYRVCSHEHRSATPALHKHRTALYSIIPMYCIFRASLFSRFCWSIHQCLGSSPNHMSLSVWPGNSWNLRCRDWPRTCTSQACRGSGMTAKPDVYSTYVYGVYLSVQSIRRGNCSWNIHLPHTVQTHRAPHRRCSATRLPPYLRLTVRILRVVYVRQ